MSANSGPGYKQHPDHRHSAKPADFDYAAVPGLSIELRQKLERHRPATLRHAAEIDGMTPSALLLLTARHRKRADGLAA